jgi:hypothetical protein
LVRIMPALIARKKIVPLNAPIEGSYIVWES